MGLVTSLIFCEDSQGFNLKETLCKGPVNCWSNFGHISSAHHQMQLIVSQGASDPSLVTIQTGDNDTSIILFSLV